MRRSIRIFGALGLALVALLSLGIHSRTLAGVPEGDNLVLLVNARNPTTAISPGEAKKIYLGNKAFWHGVVPIKVLQRPPGTAAEQAFMEQIMGMTSQRFAAHWSSRELAGKGVTPEAVADAAEIAKIVAATPGGIAYLLASEAWATNNPGVRIIEPQ